MLKAKKQKVTEVYFNERDEFAEVYTHNTELKKRLIAYAAKHPDLCYQTEDGGPYFYAVFSDKAPGLPTLPIQI